MFCTQCGFSSDGTRTFCVQCGTPIRLSKAQSLALDPINPVVSPELLLRRPWLITALGGWNLLLAAISLCPLLLFAIPSFELSTWSGFSGVILIVIAVGCLLVASMYGFTALGLLRLKSYGRVFQIILGFLGLCSPWFILSIPILIYMLLPATGLIFSGKRYDELSGSDVARLSKLPTLTNVLGIIIGGLLTLTLMSVILYVLNPKFAESVEKKKGTGSTFRLEVEKKKANDTMADMRAIGTAVEAYAVDNNSYPKAADVEALAKIVEPIYIKTLPLSDQWNNRFEYRTSEDPEVGEGIQHYVIISFSSDGLADGTDYKIQKESTNFNDDIVFSDGSFVHWPSGAVGQ